MPRTGIHLCRKDGNGALLTQHGEAFCLMKYRSLATGRVEWLWNSRNGVTPHGITDEQADPEVVNAWRQRLNAAAKEGRQFSFDDDPDPSTMLHVDWGEDAFVPNFIPPVGFRIFMSWRDLPDAFRDEYAKAWAKRLDAMEKEFGHAAPKEVAEGSPFGLKDDDPCAVTVNADLRAHFAGLAETNPYIPPHTLGKSASGLILPDKKVIVPPGQAH